MKKIKTGIWQFLWFVIKGSDIKIKIFSLIAASFTIISFCITARAEDKEFEIAKKLINPVSELISIPTETDYDRGMGADNKGKRILAEVEPVIPIPLNQSWNIISRTIIPVIYQHDVSDSDSDDFGTGDIEQDLFFSPKEFTAGGIIWGMGPVFFLPSSSENVLGQGKWSMGPIGCALRQEGPWTYGILANQIWSFAGDGNRTDVNAVYLQPFLCYITNTKTTFTINSESTYGWKGDSWSVPINLMISQLIKINGNHIQITGGTRYWIKSPDGGPEGWGARLTITLLFPGK